MHTDGDRRKRRIEIPLFPRGQKMERVSSALSYDRDSVEFSDVVNHRMDHIHQIIVDQMTFISTWITIMIANVTATWFRVLIMPGQREPREPGSI